MGGHILDIDFTVFRSLASLGYPAKPFLKVFHTRRNVADWPLVVLLKNASVVTPLKGDLDTYRKVIFDIRILDLSLKQLVLVEKQDLTMITNVENLMRHQWNTTHQRGLSKPL